LRDITPGRSEAARHAAERIGFGQVAAKATPTHVAALLPRASFLVGCATDGRNAGLDCMAGHDCAPQIHSESGSVCDFGC
jgi:hypothetical protein